MSDTRETPVCTHVVASPHEVLDSQRRAATVETCPRVHGGLWLQLGLWLHRGATAAPRAVVALGGRPGEGEGEEGGGEGRGRKCRKHSVTLPGHIVKRP